MGGEVAKSAGGSSRKQKHGKPAAADSKDAEIELSTPFHVETSRN
jgi:hypothetical protein